MTDVKELIEKIEQNPLAITDEIDWVEETNNFDADRIKEIVYKIPHEYYEPVSKAISAIYHNKIMCMHGCLHYDVNDTCIVDNKYNFLHTVYGAAPIIDNYFYYLHLERLHMDEADALYNKRINEIRIKFKDITCKELAEEETNFQIKKLKTENEKLKTENEKLKTENEVLKKAQNEKCLDFELNLGCWHEICEAMFIYALANIDDKKKYTKTQIANTLHLFTGFSKNTLYNGKENSSNEKKLEFKEEAKKFLNDLASKI